jgi:hypothetical protein
MIDVGATIHAGHPSIRAIHRALSRGENATDYEAIGVTHVFDYFDYNYSVNVA